VVDLRGELHSFYPGLFDIDTIFSRLQIDISKYNLVNEQGTCVAILKKGTLYRFEPKPPKGKPRPVLSDASVQNDDDLHTYTPVILPKSLRRRHVPISPKKPGHAAEDKAPLLLNSHAPGLVNQKGTKVKGE
jgi:hypothetical protein